MDGANSSEESEENRGRMRSREKIKDRGEEKSVENEERKEYKKLRKYVASWIETAGRLMKTERNCVKKLAKINYDKIR